MSVNTYSFQKAVDEAGLNRFSLDIVSKGMRYECDDRQATFQLPDGSFAVVAKVDSCRITTGGFAEIDSEALVRFADLLIRHYRASHAPRPAEEGRARAGCAAAAVAAAAPVPPRKGGNVCLDYAPPVPWVSVCDACPQSGGRGIRNPGSFCYLNASLAALSACSQYVRQVGSLALARPESLVTSRLASVFKALNEREKMPLRYAETVIEELALSLVSEGCPISVTDDTQMQDAAELVDFIVGAAGTRFSLYKAGGIEEVSSLMPVLPPRKKDGDDWISLEDCIGQNVVLASQAPTLLPVWLRRTTFFDGVACKIDRVCRPPLIMQVRVREGAVTQKVPYYLRAVILHHGTSPNSGHYTAVVPTTDGMKASSQYPTVWEIRNDSRAKEEQLSESLLDDVFRNGVCYLYEKSPFV